MGTFCAGGGAPGGDKWRAGGAGKNQTSATMRTAAMDQLALSLIVGGAALICSGLVFLLPFGAQTADASGNGGGEPGEGRSAFAGNAPAAGRSVLIDEVAAGTIDDIIV